MHWLLKEACFLPAVWQETPSDCRAETCTTANAFQPFLHPPFPAQRSCRSGWGSWHHGIFAAKSKHVHTELCPMCAQCCPAKPTVFILMLWISLWCSHLASESRMYWVCWFRGRVGSSRSLSEGSMEESGTQDAHLVPWAAHVLDHATVLQAAVWHFTLLLVAL